MTLKNVYPHTGDSHLKLFLARLIKVYKPFRGVLLGIFGFIAVSQVVGLGAPYVQGKIIDNLINSRPIGNTFLLVGVALTITLVQVVVVMYLRERFEIKNIDFAFPRHLNRSTLEQVLSFSLGQHINENSGIKQSVIGRGQSALKTMAMQILYQVLPTVVQILFLIGALLYFSKIIGLIALVGVSICVWFVIFTNQHFSKDFKNLEKLYNKNSKFQGEVLRNVELVISNAQEERAVRECDEDLGKAFSLGEKVAVRFNNFAVVRNLIMSIVRVAILGTGVFLVYRGIHTVGELVMFLAWSNQAIGEIFMIGNLHRHIIQSYSSVHRYFEMLSIEPDVKVLPNPVHPDRFLGKIEFRNVTIRYTKRDGLNDTEEESEEVEVSQLVESKESSPALCSVSFTIEQGETVALVGESGAGKSTIVQALLRALDPEEGQIVVDGHDLRVIDLTHFRQSIGIVDQDVSLFDHTLRYNLTYGLSGREATIKDSDLDQIAEMSCIDRFFPRLESGYDTIIGERGVKLSGGEKQRVGIARALIKDPDILIFDEATSSLDSINETLIRDSIEKASAGRTTIIIAHRFSTIRKVDKVIVLSKGRVVGIGTHEELALNCAPYQDLIKNQKI